MAETFILIPGRSSRQGVTLNEGKYTPGYQHEITTLRMNPDDMAAMHVAPGDRIRVWNAIGEFTAPCVDAGDELPRGMLFIAYGDLSCRVMPPDTHGSGMPDSKGLDVFAEPAEHAAAAAADAAPDAEPADQPLSAPAQTPAPDTRPSASVATWAAPADPQAHGTQPEPGEPARRAHGEDTRSGSTSSIRATRRREHPDGSGPAPQQSPLAVVVVLAILGGLLIYAMNSLS